MNKWLYQEWYPNFCQYLAIDPFQGTLRRGEWFLFNVQKVLTDVIFLEISFSRSPSRFKCADTSTCTWSGSVDGSETGNDWLDWPTVDPEVVI